MEIIKKMRKGSALLDLMACLYEKELMDLNELAELAGIPAGDIRKSLTKRRVRMRVTGTGGRWGVQYTNFGQSYKKMIGEKYGSLLVLGVGAQRISDRVILLFVRCDCGNEELAPARFISSGKKVRCSKCTAKLLQSGLQRKRGAYRDGGLRARYNRYKARVLKEGKHVFELTFDEWKEIVLSDCLYCGDPPSQTFMGSKEPGKRRYEAEIAINGIDRYWNDCGYTVINSVPCCWDCNSLKKKRDGDDYLKKIFKSASYNS